MAYPKSEPFLWFPHAYLKPYSAKLEDGRSNKVTDQIFRNRKDCMECHQRHIANNPYVSVPDNRNVRPKNKAYKPTDLTKSKRNRWGRRVAPQNQHTVYISLKQEKSGYQQSVYFYGLDPSQPVEIETRDFHDSAGSQHQKHNFVLPAMKLSLESTIIKTMREQQPNSSINMKMVSELVKAIGAK